MGFPHTTNWHSTSSNNLYGTQAGLQLVICRQGITTPGNAISWPGRQVPDSLSYNHVFDRTSGYNIKSFLIFCIIRGGEQRDNQCI